LARTAASIARSRVSSATARGAATMKPSRRVHRAITRPAPDQEGTAGRSRCSRDNARARLEHDDAREFANLSARGHEGTRAWEGCRRARRANSATCWSGSKGARDEATRSPCSFAPRRDLAERGASKRTNPCRDHAMHREGTKCIIRAARVKGQLPPGGGGHTRRVAKGRARRFNITDKVIIISVCTTDINRRCQTHKEIIVASLKGGGGGGGGGRKAKRSFYIVYSREPTATIKGSLEGRRSEAADRSIIENTTFVSPQRRELNARRTRPNDTMETQLIKFS